MCLLVLLRLSVLERSSIMHLFDEGMGTILYSEVCLKVECSDVSFDTSIVSSFLDYY